MLEQNIESVLERISAAARASGRDESDIKLIAVTKTQPVEVINRAIELGLNVIGENRVQELLQKFEHLLPCEAHLIGQLQSNKAKSIVGKVELIHSLDRHSLAKEIDAHASALGIVCNCLVQVNIGSEGQKGGINAESTELFIDELRKYRNISVKGLMAVPPICGEIEAARYFNQLRAIAKSVNHNREITEKLTELSMGMSNDFEVAIKCGATIVRIGGAIFGKRVNQ